MSGIHLNLFKSRPGNRTCLKDISSVESEISTIHCIFNLNTTLKGFLEAVYNYSNNFKYFTCYPSSWKFLQLWNGVIINCVNAFFCNLGRWAKVVERMKMLNVFFTFLLITVQVSVVFIILLGLPTKHETLRNLYCLYPYIHNSLQQ